MAYGSDQALLDETRQKRWALSFIAVFSGVMAFITTATRERGHLGTYAPSSRGRGSSSPPHAADSDEKASSASAPVGSSRRAQCASALLWVTAACNWSGLGLPAGPALAARGPPAPSLLSVDGEAPGGQIPVPLYQAVRVIKRYCEDNGVLSHYREAGGRLLYRGESVETPAALIYTPPDLLDPATYHDSEAAAWFKAVDHAMRSRKDPVCPSEGHLATSDLRAAGSWGMPCSIWPLGPLHFAWLAHEREWWATNGRQQQGKAPDYRALRSDSRGLESFLDRPDLISQDLLETCQKAA